MPVTGATIQAGSDDYATDYESVHEAQLAQEDAELWMHSVSPVPRLIDRIGSRSSTAAPARASADPWRGIAVAEGAGAVAFVGEAQSERKGRLGGLDFTNRRGIGMSSLPASWAAPLVRSGGAIVHVSAPSTTREMRRRSLAPEYLTTIMASRPRLLPY